MLISALGSIFIILTNVFDVSFSFPGVMLGPGNLIIKSFEHSDPPNTDLSLWISQRKFNRTTNVLDITIITPWPLGTEIDVELTFAIKRDGGYKPGSFYVKDTFCSLMKTMLSDVFVTFLEVAGVEDCPIPAGTYEITDFYLDGDKMPKQMVYGDYRVQINFYHKGALVGSYYFFVDVLPRDQ